MKENQNSSDPNEEKPLHLDEFTEDEDTKAIIKYGPVTVSEVILAASGCFIASFFSRTCIFLYFYPAFILTTIACIITLSYIVLAKKKSPYRFFTLTLCLMSYLLLIQSSTTLCH